VIARRAGRWLAWWVLLMIFWIILDDSVAADELLAGAGAAALGALLAELCGHQAATQLRLRIGWLGPALRLPAGLARDTWIVFAALGRLLFRGEQPQSGFREIPVRYGSQTPEAKTRRALLVGGTSFAPNAFVADLDEQREVMIVHELVPTQEGAAP
jgi:multisubunit Na+/H+ antiporter MnhE subunit